MKNSLNNPAAENMLNLAAAMSENGLEEQERHGQAKFVSVENLPKKCPKEDLEKLGFKFGEDVDDLFVSVQFPEGWKKESTDHSMWSDLIDSQGRKRAGIFYKASFYDRSAHMSLKRRYTSTKDYKLEDNQIQYHVLDGDEVIFKTKVVTCDRKSDDYWDIDEKVEKEAKDYLADKYPDYEKCTAYWG
jgi:hypothetical protein